MDMQGDRSRKRVREWDRNKMPEEREGERVTGEWRVRKTPPAPTKRLEELFQRTTATPAIYWKPLSEQQIQQRNKKMIEAKIMRDMEDSKETPERQEVTIGKSTMNQ